MVQARRPATAEIAEAQRRQAEHDAVIAEADRAIQEDADWLDGWRWGSEWGLAEGYRRAIAEHIEAPWRARIAAAFCRRGPGLDRLRAAAAAKVPPPYRPAR